MEKELYIRRYSPNDREVVWRLHDVALRDAGIHLGDDGPWYDDLGEVPEVYLRGGGEFFVGVLGGEIVAMGGVKKTDENRAEIKYMRVDPGLKRRGLGQTILAALEQSATELGYETLHLDTAARQKAARRLYEANGYREIRRDRKGSIDCIFYEKRLD